MIVVLSTPTARSARRLAGMTVRPLLSPQGRRMLDLTLVAAAFVLGLVGLFVFVFHLATDPLVDVHAYYAAAQRLNAGQPLYGGQTDVNAADFYRYPPLLAILFRPLALLPFQMAALIWGLAIVAALGLTLWRLGLRRQWTWVAVGVLGGPIAWSVAIGQAQVVVTLLLALGNPASVAVAAQLKVFPALVALYWIGRRDWQNLGRFLAWSAALMVVQLVLAPAGSLAFIGLTNLGEVGQVNNLSPYATSPLLWMVLAVIGFVVTIRLAPSRVGWAVAIAYSVFASPRLLEYMLATLLAALRQPPPSRATRIDDPGSRSTDRRD